MPRERGALVAFCCRGRIRTSTGQLAVAQSVVVNPSRTRFEPESALHYVYPGSPPPRQEGMSAKFHHSTIKRPAEGRMAVGEGLEPPRSG